MTSFDTIVIGGGFYGSCLASWRAASGARVAVLEREPELLRRASYRNQARAHNGYHYPRSFRTAVRARAELPRFADDFDECIDRTFEQHYAISRRLSKVSAAQFELFCRRIGAPIAPADSSVARLFSSERIEAVFRVEEYAFDADGLREALARRLSRASVEILCSHSARRLIAADTGGIVVEARHGDREIELLAPEVICCAYSENNQILARSGLPTVELKHEIAEIALIEPPPQLSGIGVTVMCGPFFSTMPFPPTGAHTLSHVRYTPHASWRDEAVAASRDPGAVLSSFPKQTRFREMVQDAQRYLPLLNEAEYVDSLWEVKTVLPRNESDDGRPIMIRENHGLDGLTVVLGAKIDSVYEIESYLTSRQEAAT